MLPPFDYFDPGLDIMAATRQQVGNYKKQLSTTDLSVSEIAYELGFEHLRSFSKLFKAKTNLSPLEFQTSFSSESLQPCYTLLPQADHQGDGERVRIFCNIQFMFFGI
jgi:hypothetical protein